MSQFKANKPFLGHADLGVGSCQSANSPKFNQKHLVTASHHSNVVRKEGDSGDVNPSPVDDKRVASLSDGSPQWVDWITYVANLPWGPGERDKSGHLAFLRAGSLWISPDRAIEEITRRISTTGGTFNILKIRGQQRRAYGYVGNLAEGHNAIVKPPRLNFDPMLLERFTAHLSHVDAAWLKEHSPVPAASVSNHQFLEQLYLPGEKVVVFTVFESQGQCIYEVGDRWSPPLPEGSPNGVWFLVNPVDGGYHPNPRQEDRESRRSQESITAWRYMVLESDDAPSDQWIAALVQLPLKIAAIYTSGGKSIHALVQVDANDKNDWDRQRDTFRQVVVPLGADEAALTAVRLSRLPGTMRGNRLQELLYLDPEPNGTPIIKKQTK